MSDSAIQALLTAEPFEPFTVHMPHGVEYDIDRPERAALSEHGGALWVYTASGAWRAVLSLDHVVSITFPPKPLVRGGVT